MQPDLTEKLQWIADSFALLVPELMLFMGLVAVLISGFFKSINFRILQAITLATLAGSMIVTLTAWPANGATLFSGMLRLDNFSSCFKILFCTGGIITAAITRSENLPRFKSEYFLLIITVVLGANLLVMSLNFVMVVLSLELISISSYVLAGFRFTKRASEGSIKYFLFGSAATAIMIYGISLIFGISGTLNFAGQNFIDSLIQSPSLLLLTGGLMVLVGFLFKIAAVPFHLWAPDIYEAATTPVVAFFSVVPKLAGLGALAKFTMAINLFGQSGTDWQVILAVISALSLLVGNFSALWQKDARRMMAYSSIAQTGYLLIGLVAMSLEATQIMIFYASVFMVSNMLVFIYLQQLEQPDGRITIEQLSGVGKSQTLASVFISIGLISLVGIPPTAGFTSKLLIFSALWQAYDATGKIALLVLFLFGLINTVVSLFFYLRIPYYLFFRNKDATPAGLTIKSLSIENLLGAILVVLVLCLFFRPDVLMGWINRVNFVL